MIKARKQLVKAEGEKAAIHALLVADGKISEVHRIEDEERWNRQVATSRATTAQERAEPADEAVNTPLIRSKNASGQAEDAIRMRNAARKNAKKKQKHESSLSKEPAVLKNVPLYRKMQQQQRQKKQKPQEEKRKE